MTTPGDGVDLDALVALAEAATPGPWQPYNDGVVGFPGIGKGLVPTKSSDEDTRQRIYDARFIAACDPATILGLVERVKEAEADRDEWKQAAVDEAERANRLTKFGQAVRLTEVEAERDRLRAAITIAIKQRGHGSKCLSWQSIDAVCDCWKADLRAVLDGDRP